MSTERQPKSYSNQQKLKHFDVSLWLGNQSRHKDLL